MSARFSQLAGRARHWSQQRLPWALLLLALAVCYYASYVRYGINFRDEGGTVALVSKRLLDGERPFLDVILNYNVLWFYPVVGLFKLCGVNFVLLRAYCFVLSTGTVLLSFFIVERAGRRPWLAFLVALPLLLVPGMTFKNYMPLLAVGNAFCLLHFVLGPRPPRVLESAPSGAELLGVEAPGRTWKWLCLGALALGLTLLIRIDVGIFTAVLWLGAIALRALGGNVAGRPRLPLLIGGPLALAGIVLVVHLPVYADAAHRGFARPFIAQYADWPADMVVAARERLGSPHAPAAPPAPAPTPTPSPATLPPAGEKEAAWSTGGLGRLQLSEFTHLAPAKRQLLILLYAPLFTLLPLVAWAALATLRAWRRPEPEAFALPLGALVLLGAALTVFPQYFFFRPDAPHLSEFSPGFWVGAFGAALLLGFGRSGASRTTRLFASVLLLLLSLHAALYLWRMLPDRWTGTIAARTNRHTLFHGDNGVEVFVSKREAEALQQLRDLVRQHSTSADYLVAYPYHPSLNLLCDRRTYEHNVYVDNATRGPGWNEAAIARFQQFRPAVVIVSDWAVNGTDASRFSAWASPTKTWLQTNYLTQGTYLDFEVFTRPEREQ